MSNGETISRLDEAFQHEQLVDRDAKLTAVESIIREYIMHQKPWVEPGEYLKRIASLLGVK